MSKFKSPGPSGRGLIVKNNTKQKHMILHGNGSHKHVSPAPIQNECCLEKNNKPEIL